MNKLFIIFLCVVIVVAGLILAYTFQCDLQSIKASKTLVEAIGNHDLLEVGRIINEYPDCVNTLPSFSPRWFQVIAEQPTVSYPLQRACWGGNYDIVKLLIENGADCNLVWKGIEGSKTPLIRAVLSGSENMTDILNILLEFGADKSIKDYRGKTAYDYAKELGYINLVDLLQP